MTVRRDATDSRRKTGLTSALEDFLQAAATVLANLLSEDMVVYALPEGRRNRLREARSGKRADASTE